MNQLMSYTRNAVVLPPTLPSLMFKKLQRSLSLQPKPTPRFDVPPNLISVWAEEGIAASSIAPAIAAKASHATCLFCTAITHSLSDHAVESATNRILGGGREISVNRTHGTAWLPRGRVNRHRGEPNRAGGVPDLESQHCLGSLVKQNREQM